MILNILTNRILIENIHYVLPNCSYETLVLKIFGIMKINNIKGKIKPDIEKGHIIVKAPMEDMYKLLYDITWVFSKEIKEIR